MGERNLSVADVARGAGVHRNVITKYANNEQEQYSRIVIGKLCSSLEVVPGDLIVLDYRAEPATRRWAIHFEIDHEDETGRDLFLRELWTELDSDEERFSVFEYSRTVVDVSWEDGRLPDLGKVESFAGRMRSEECINAVTWRVISARRPRVIAANKAQTHKGRG